MRVAKSPADRVAAYVATFSDPAYEAHPYDPFEDTTTPRRRQRRMSLKRVIACAKQAGADVIVNGITIVTSPVAPHGAPETTEADAEQLWHDRIKKHAAH